MKKTKGTPVNSKPLVSEVTEEQIQAWKEKHTVVKQISIPVDYYDEDEEIPEDAERIEYIICRPQRNTTNAAAKYVGQGKYDAASRVMIKNCVLAGDMSYLEGNGRNTDVLDGVMEELNKMLSKRGVEAKKL